MATRLHSIGCFVVTDRRRASNCTRRDRVAQLCVSIRFVGSRAGGGPVFTAFEKALTDCHASAAREMARSLIASSMWRWGCRYDPQRWRWGHLRTVLEDELRTSRSRHLGDAWMLAAVVLEAQTDVLSGAGAEELARVRTYGRWQEAFPGALGTALSRTARHFATPRTRHGTRLVYSPVADGGLGAAVRPGLMAAGAVAVGHYCVDTATGASWMGFEEARGVFKWL